MFAIMVGAVLAVAALEIVGAVLAVLAVAALEIVVALEEAPRQILMQTTPAEAVAALEQVPQPSLNHAKHVIFQEQEMVLVF